MDIITDDIDYSVYLKNNENISALHLGEYMLTKQAIINTSRLDIIKDYNIFKFLLIECRANPNVGSRNPYSTKR